MDELRILLVGFPQFEMGFREGSRVISSVEVPSLDDETIKHVKIFPRTDGKKVLRTFDTNPTFYDHQVVILHPSAVTHETLKHNLLGKKDEVESFLEHIDGFLVIPLVGDDVIYSWLPDEVRSETAGKTGERINFNYDHWMFPFVEKAKRHVKFSWRGHLNSTITGLPPKERGNVIGINLLGSPVSWEKRFGKGRVIFLPHFDFVGGKTRDGKRNAELFTRSLIDSLRGQLSGSRAQEAPEWVGRKDYRLGVEEEISKRIQELRQRRGAFAKARDVLWKRGHELTLAAGHVLKEMGFSPVLRKDYTGDIELRERGLHALVRVVDTKGIVDVRDMRHLLDWYVGELGKDGDLKGVLVVNHFRETEPAARSSELSRIRLKHPFSKEVFLLAKDNGLCLMTTTQLFEIFKEFVAGGTNKTEIIRLIKRTNGPMGSYRFKPLK